REEIIGRKVVELSQWLGEETTQVVRHVLNEGRSVPNFEARVFTKSGEERFILGSIQRVEFDEPCFLWAANDITDRKVAENLLQASERRFSVAFNSNPVMTSISRLDDGKFLAVNESFLQVTGFRQDEIIGKTALGLGLWLDPVDRDEIMRRLDERGSVRNVE